MGNSSSSSQSNAPASESADSTPKPPSYYSMVKNSYQALVNAIIRPPRSKYEASKLGPEQFLFCGKTITRKDFTLVNPREQRFCCSMWEPIERDRANPLLPCVVYMHGNSSSRLEALSALSLVLSLGATVLAFDFAGSGKSDGDYVTLGAFEKDDLQVKKNIIISKWRTCMVCLLFYFNFSRKCSAVRLYANLSVTHFMLIYLLLAFIIIPFVLDIDTHI